MLLTAGKSGRNIIMYSISTAIAQAPSICIGFGETLLGSNWVWITHEQDEFYFATDLDGLEEEGQLFTLIESCAENIFPFKGLDVEGDMAIPRATVFSANTDIMQLAKSHKRLEAANSEELLFGIELEFNHTGHSLMELSPLLGIGIFKEDSSVDGEFVTLPYTYDELTEKVNKLAEQFDKLLSANHTLHPWSEVGMHVHISRKGLSNTQLSLLRFAFGASSTIAPVSYCCGRYPNQYCSYLRWEKDRYVALNEANEHTVEVRAFLSPSSAKGVLKNLQMVKDIMEGRWLQYENIDVTQWWQVYQNCSYKDGGLVVDRYANSELGYKAAVPIPT